MPKYLVVDELGQVECGLVVRIRPCPAVAWAQSGVGSIWSVSGQSVSRRGRLMGGDVRASSLSPVNDPYHAVELSMRDGPTSQA